jgi:hypothetical protein
MTQGPLDNYLSTEEETYFKTQGKNEESIGYDEEAGASSSEPAYGGDNEDESKYDQSPVEAKLLGQEVPESESEDGATDGNSDDDEAENDTTNKRDYEKAFKTERHKRRELKEQMEAHARKTAELESTLAQLKNSMMTPRQEAQAAPVAPVQQEVIPDPEVDPLGYQQYEINSLKKALGQQHQYLSEQQQRSQRVAQEQAFMQAYKNSADQFAQATPDFYDAYKYIVAEKTKEFVAAGYTPAEADRLVIEDEMAIASRAFQQNANPAERIYNVARNRGYTGKAKVAPANTKTIDSLKKGLDNSKSLKSGGGELGDRANGLEDIDGMNFAEFDNFWADLKSKSKGR